MVIDPRELRPRQAVPSRRTLADDAVVKGDRPCASCGANLRGLAGWAKCPDCGAPVDPAAHAAGISAPQAEPPRRPRARGLVHVRDLPRSAKWRLAVGTRVAALGLAAFAAPPGLIWLLMVVRSQSWLQGVEFRALESLLGWAAGAVALPGALAWCAGLWILIPSVPPKPRDKAEALATAHTLGGLMVDHPRWWPGVVRAAPLAWPVLFALLAGSIAAGGVNTPSGQQLWTVMLAVTAIASIAHAAACAFLRELALIVCDDVCASRCLQSAFLLPVLLVFTGIFLSPESLFSEEISPLSSITGGFQGIFLMVLFFALVGYPVWRFIAGVWSLAHSCSWSVLNDFQAQDKDARFVANSLKIERQAAADRERLGELD